MMEYYRISEEELGRGAKLPIRKLASHPSRPLGEELAESPLALGSVADAPRADFVLSLAEEDFPAAFEHDLLLLHVVAQALAAGFRVAGGRPNDHRIADCLDFPDLEGSLPRLAGAAGG